MVASVDEYLRSTSHIQIHSSSKMGSSKNHSYRMSEKACNDMAFKLSNRHFGWKALRQLHEQLDRMRAVLFSSSGIAPNIAHDLTNRLQGISARINDVVGPIIQDSVRARVETEDIKRNLNRTCSNFSSKMRDLEQLKKTLSEKETELSDMMGELRQISNMIAHIEEIKDDEEIAAARIDVFKQFEAFMRIKVPTAQELPRSKSETTFAMIRNQAPVSSFASSSAFDDIRPKTPPIITGYPPIDRDLALSRAKEDSAAAAAAASLSASRSNFRPVSTISGPAALRNPAQSSFRPQSRLAFGNRPTEPFSSLDPFGSVPPTAPRDKQARSTTSTLSSRSLFSGDGHADPFSPTQFGSRSRFNSFATNNNRNLAVLGYGGLSAPPQPHVPLFSGSNYSMGSAENKSLVHFGGKRDISTLSPYFDEMYEGIRAWINSHHAAGDGFSANFDHLQHSSIFPYFLAIYTPLNQYQAASYIRTHLEDDTARSCLIARIIIDYFVHRAWSFSAWAGFNHQTTQIIMEIDAQLDRLNTAPPHVRQPIIDKLVSTVHMIMQDPNYAEFVQHKIEHMAEQLRSSCLAMENKHVDNSQLIQDAEMLCQNAWELAERIVTSRMCFEFRYPHVAARFTTGSMVPIKPNMNPVDLQASHWRVSLVVTPVVMARDDTGSEVAVHNLMRADVICMK